MKKCLSAWPMGVLPLMVVGACFSVIAGFLALITAVIDAIAWAFGMVRDGALIVAKELHEWTQEIRDNEKLKQEKRDAP